VAVPSALGVAPTRAGSRHCALRKTDYGGRKPTTGKRPGEKNEDHKIILCLFHYDFIFCSNFYKIDDICFLHGDKMFSECTNSKLIIMGHLHPAITLKDEYKKAPKMYKGAIRTDIYRVKNVIADYKQQKIKLKKHI